MSIRKADENDIDQLLKIRLDFLAERFHDISDESSIKMSEQIADYYVKHINRDFIAYIAEEDGHAVSSAYMCIYERPANPNFITGKVGEILNVYTYPDFRRQGLASELIKKIIDDAKSMSISRLELDATPDGYPVYTKLGFNEDCRGCTHMELKL